ncbi:MAG: hypothetical protein IJU95_00485 [Treponema sp.]|nr:hypothetical protein [Treponema sp.]
MNKLAVLVKMIRQLVSDVQGAPYPGQGLEPEVYKIWYEHVQKNAQDCNEFLAANFPLETKEFNQSIDKMFKQKA